MNQLKKCHNDPHKHVFLWHTINVEPIALYFMNVTRYTRAGREGKCIECPECQNQAVVWHFAWSALTCTECEVSYPKYDWKIAACELAS